MEQSTLIRRFIAKKIILARVFLFIIYLLFFAENFLKCTQINPISFNESNCNYSLIRIFNWSIISISEDFLITFKH